MSADEHEHEHEHGRGHGHGHGQDSDDARDRRVNDKRADEHAEDEHAEGVRGDGRRDGEPSAAAEPPASGAAAPDAVDGEEEGLDELALRRIMHRAVEEIEPSDAALDHLRRAVPARRARKRQAMVGVAAAALFIGTAVPALVHVTNSPGSSDDRPSIAGHGEDVHGGTGGDERGPERRERDAEDRADPSKSKEKDGAKEREKEKGGEAGSGTGVGPDPSGTMAVTSPVCDASQLGGADATAGAPDAEGKVYGGFRVSNVSNTSCTVSGSGSVGAMALGAADAARVNVVDHTAGDAATELPEPVMARAELVLAPGASYEVKFAWVPAESCPSTGGGSGGSGSGGASPEPTPSDDTGSADQSTMDTQMLKEDGGTADGSVTVSHVAEPGAPNAGTTISNACAGTVYRTGVLPVQQ